MIDRRGILKFIGGGVIGVLASPIIWKGMDDSAIWSQNWSWRPQNQGGETSYKATISKLCPTSQGMMVRFTGERPVRTHGNPDHPLSLGALSALAAAEVQLLYSPARVRQPMRRQADGSFAPISWAEAEKLLAAGLEKGRGAGNFMCISGDENGSMTEFLSGLTAAMGSDLMFGMPSDAQAAAIAWEMCGGKGQLGYDLENTDHILAVGANVLENWGTVLRNRRVFAEARPHGEDPALTLHYAGAVQNNTAAVADAWLPILPGTETIFILGLIHELAGGLSSLPADIAELAAAWPADKAAKACGIEASRITACATALRAANAPLVLVGSADNQGIGAAPIVAGIALNALLGTKALRDLPLAPVFMDGALNRAQLARHSLPAWVNSIDAGEQPPHALMVYEANPVYALPNADRAAKALAAIPFKVAFTSFLDETAAMCDLVLPVPMGLERADDADTPYGCGQIVYTQSAPLLPSLVDSRMADAVLAKAMSTLNVELGVKSLQEIMQAKLAAYGGRVRPGMPLLGQTGPNLEFFGHITPYAPVIREHLAEFTRSKHEGALALSLVGRLAMGTANSGIPPFNTKTIRRNELSGKQTCVMLNSITARKLNLREGDRVNIYTPDTAVEAVLAATVSINEGVALDTAAVLAGLGHTALDAFSTGKGDNILRLMPFVMEPVSGLPLFNRGRIDIIKA